MVLYITYDKQENKSLKFIIYGS